MEFRHCHLGCVSQKKTRDFEALLNVEFRILFDLVLTLSLHHKSFFYVNLCKFLFYLDLVWVKMTILDQNSLHSCTWKIQLLAPALGFLAVLTLSSYTQLSDKCGCFCWKWSLIRKVSNYVPKNKFGISRDSCWNLNSGNIFPAFFFLQNYWHKILFPSLCKTFWLLIL